MGNSAYTEVSVQGIQGNSVQGTVGSQGSGGIQGNVGTSVQGSQGSSIQGAGGSQGTQGTQGTQGKSGSDIRLKKNIRPFTDSLQTVEKLKPVFFQWNGLGGFKNTGDDVVGIIANELEPIMPYAVSRYADKLIPEGEESEIATYDPNAILFALVNSTKELQKYVYDLERRVKILEEE